MGILHATLTMVGFMGKGEGEMTRDTRRAFT